MTPTSCGAGTSGYYQFAQLNHGYSGMVSAAQLDAYIASTANGRTGTLAGNGEAFVNAARRYGVNEVYLLAHAILESGWGTSTLAKGYVYDGKTLVDGKTWPKVQHLFLCGRARDCTIPLPGAEPAGAYAASVTGILQQGASFSGNIAQVLSVVRTFAEAG